MSTATVERSQLSVAITSEVKDLVCEILDVESFEITTTSPLARYERGERTAITEIAETLECAFGVTLDPTQVTMMVDLNGVYGVLDAALRAKRLRLCA